MPDRHGTCHFILKPKLLQDNPHIYAFTYALNKKVKVGLGEVALIVLWDIDRTVLATKTVQQPFL